MRLQQIDEAQALPKKKAEDRKFVAPSVPAIASDNEVEPEARGWDWAAPRLALLAMAGSCGTNFPLIHIVEETMSPSQATFLRFTCATLPFLPLLANRLAALNWDLRADKTMLPGLEIGAWCALGYVTQAIGLAQTAPAKGAFICALFMVITPLINGLAGRRVELQAYLAVVVALMGTAVHAFTPAASPRSAAKPRATRLRLSTDDAGDDPFDMGLLKLPQLTTPSRQNFDKFRKRQQQRSQAAAGEFDLKDPNAPTPLGLDPVEGDPVDLTKLWSDSSNDEPSAEEIAETNAQFDGLVRGEAPDGFGDGLDGFA